MHFIIVFALLVKYTLALVFEQIEMYVKVPEVRRCCFCVPLRHGIIIFGVLNTLLTMLAAACLVVTAQPPKHPMHGSSLEEITSAILFGILGMSIILNMLLLVAGCQKDVTMLRLYNCYMVGTAIAALVPAFVLLSRMQTLEVCGAFIVILIQCYVIVLVRSEILKLEKRDRPGEVAPSTDSHIVDIADTDVLIF